MKKTLTLVPFLFALAASALLANAEDGARAPGDQEKLKARAFSAEHLHERRRALARALGSNALIVLSSGKDTESDALQHRANRDFMYLTGIEDPGCSVIIDGESEVVYAPQRNARAEIWTGVHVYASEETATRYGFTAARRTDAFKKDLAAAREHAEKIFQAGFRKEEVQDVFGTKDVESALTAIGRLRQVKDDDELALMKRAAEISAVAHLYCTKAIAPDRFEYEVQGLFEGCCRFYGCEAQGYPSIVGSGPNSCILHYDKNRRQMKSGDMLVLDAAGECGGYSADVTRTFPISGKFTDEQRKVYNAVLRAQDAGIKMCRPGVTVREVGEASRAVLKEEGYLEYLPHGVSHWLGLDVHDAGDYSLPLAPGMVLTVEPGIYIAAKELGCRIEDDILVTEDGPVNLSGYAPRKAEEIEALLAKAKAGKLELPPLPDTPAIKLGKKHKGRLY